MNEYDELKKQYDEFKKKEKGFDWEKEVQREVETLEVQIKSFTDLGWETARASAICIKETLEQLLDKSRKHVKKS